MGDDDVLNEFRQKQANFDLEEKRNEINNSRSLFIGALAGLAMAAVVGWFVLAPQYQSGEEEEVPVIRRPQEEVKIPPVEPGSVEISNQEKTVYDIIERKPENPEEANVLPPSEQPNADAIEALVEEVTAKENAAPAAKTNEIRAESLAAPAKPAEVKREAEKVPVVPVTAEAAAEKEKPVAGRAEEPVPAETKAVRTAVKAERPAPKAKEAAPAAAKQETIAKGTWQIQLMSSPNKAAVEKSWKTMSAKYKILSGLPHEVSSVDLGAKGTYYRLKAGSFATKAEAAALCGKLKAAGGSRETRTIQRDPELKIEICTFREVVHRFPLHFHDHYVIGCIVSGRRKLFCSGKTFEVKPGDLLLFNPRLYKCFL